LAQAFVELDWCSMLAVAGADVLSIYLTNAEVPHGRTEQLLLGCEIDQHVSPSSRLRNLLVSTSETRPG
jgi:hypothetical protein